MLLPHIVVDFDLATAMRKGLVKTLLLDRRQELTELKDLDYKAVRDERNKVCDLSDGQRLMLRAGLAKLKRLETEFTALDVRRHVCGSFCKPTDVGRWIGTRGCCHHRQ